MKITFVLPYAGLDGGIRVVAIHAERLKQRGHAVTVVSVPEPPLSFKQKLKALLTRGRWPSSRRGPSHFDGLAVEHKVLERHRPITNDDVPDADVVIATWWETAEWVNGFSPAKGRKFYFVQGHDVRREQPVERVKLTYRLPMRKITISHWLRQVMSQEYGDHAVALVPNSVDTDFFNAPARGRQPVATVGFVYSTSPDKGCDIILAALAEVRRRMPGLRIKAFGACRPAPALPLVADSEFHWQPSQELIRQIYRSCDFWLFGSRAEGFGLPLLEAMACRTPVIATKAGAAPELVTQGRGLLVDGYSPEAMATALVQGLALPEREWQAMSAAARMAVMGHSWDDATDLFEQELLAGMG